MTPEPRDPWTDPETETEILRLQATLRPLRHQTRPLPERCFPPRRRPRWGLALAAAVLVAVIGPSAGAAWRFSWPEGAAWSGTIMTADGASTAVQLEPGREFQVPGTHHAEFAIARLGSLQLDPGTTLRLIETRSGQHRAELLQGRLHARVWAPPGVFGVQLGQTRALDLGCVFTLSRDAAGHARLEVQSGWVLLSGPHESLVPAGAQADIDPVRGPGTPYRHVAAPALRTALARIDALQGGVAPSGPEVAAVLDAASDADALSLVALLSRYPTLAAGPLLPRTERALPQAAAVDRERLRRGDPSALNPLWEALPYPRAKSWWLHWRDAY
ncbi:MAG: hypothetical protein MUE46_10090 [Xanthomonadales bacterium]|jgi:hypothetical protein|nr:hypothetical protein [Xanthomonadales bacterium]